MSSVAVILGSPSDRHVFEKCKKVFEEFGVEYDIRIISAHRTPEKLERFVKESDSDVFIAIAGMSAALPGVVASKTTKPVIGVPVESKLDGLDALLSVVQMPPGIPVGCVGVDRGENAALLAIEVLAINNDELKAKLENYRRKMKEKTEKDDTEAQRWK